MEEQEREVLSQFALHSPDMTEAAEPDSQTEPPNRLCSMPAMIGVQLLVAAAGLVVEILAGRMLAPYVGMSLYTWTAVIAVVLAGFSAGHWAGGYIAQKPVSVALAQTGVAMAFGALSTALTLLLLRSVAAGVISNVDNSGAAILMLACIIAFLPSFFAGIPSPVLARVAVGLTPGGEGKALGAIFAASSLGAIAGTLATGFVFIAWFGTALTVLIVVIVYVLLAAFLLLAAGGAPHRWTIFAVSAGAIALGLYNLTAANVCTKESRYYCIRIIDFSQQTGTESKLMVLDHLGHGINIRDDPQRLITPYVALMDRVLTLRLAGRPETSFFIGGGAYTLPRAWAHGAQSSSVTVAEIDPDVSALAQSDMWLQAQSIEIIHADARTTLQQLETRFQVIVGDAFTDIAVPPHLVTQEFFELVNQRLLPGGVFAMNVVDHANSLQALFAVYVTLKAVFAHVDVFVEEGDLASGGRTTFVLFASDTAGTIDKADDPRDPNSSFVRLPADKLRARIAKQGAVLLTDNYAPIARLVGIGTL